MMYQVVLVLVFSYVMSKLLRIVYSRVYPDA